MTSFCPACHAPRRRVASRGGLTALRDPDELYHNGAKVRVQPYMVRFIFPLLKYGEATHEQLIASIGGNVRAKTLRFYRGNMIAALRQVGLSHVRIPYVFGEGYAIRFGETQ